MKKDKEKKREKVKRKECVKEGTREVCFSGSNGDRRPLQFCITTITGIRPATWSTVIDAQASSLQSYLHYIDLLWTWRGTRITFRPTVTLNLMVS